MGRKTKLKLYQGARDCINQLRCSNPSKHIAENDLAICIIFITRRHLRETALGIIDIIEKDTENSIDKHKCLLKRYYKLNQIHKCQLKRYSRKFESLQNDCLFNNLQYLQSINVMINNCSRIHFIS
jgi:hypothetical protein